MALLDYIPPSPGSNYAWYPINAAQTTALHSQAQVMMYGGASGGGKTDVLVADAAQERDNKNLRAVIIRKAFTEMGNIIDRSSVLYKQMGAYWRGNPHNYWLFPSGSQVRLGYMSSDDDVSKWQGNPFTFLGVDESTHQTEDRIRRIMPWLASTDPSLFVRARLATNPGDVGADWHMHVFLRGKCPVHFPDESVKPGAVYRGSTWQKDGKPLLKTVSFIPAFVRDNPLYGQEKIDALMTQEAAIADKLLTGCWCRLEGRYYKFLTPDYKRPIDEANEQWWYSYTISIDYGYGDSWAAAGLYCRTEPTIEFPVGRMFKVGEIVEKEMGSVDFAHRVIEEFYIPCVGGKTRNIVAAFCDPANDAHTGTGKSNMDLMGEVFRKYDIPLLKSAKDRVGNAQNAYSRLKKRELVITDRCPMTFKSLNSRMHDPKRPSDVLKVKGDPLDDLYDETSYMANTFPASTEVPSDVAIAEKLKKMKEAGLDEHSLMVHQVRMQQEATRAEEPMRIGRTYGRMVKR